jgi:Zn finger protein HypA/HybF involved in hydrogenase expression
MKRISIEIQTKEFCAYGCGNLAKYKNGTGNLMCSERSSSCPAVRKKNSDKLKEKYAQGRDAKEIYNNLPQQVKDKMNWNKGNFSKTKFEYNGKGNHKAVLIEERGHKCENCLNAEWLDTPITLELEHCDGDRLNNTRENLKLLCPNCHSLTKTWRGRNINKGIKKVSDENLIFLLNKNISLRQVLLQAGLTPKGGNYERLHKLMKLTNEKNVIN